MVILSKKIKKIAIIIGLTSLLCSCGKVGEMNYNTSQTFAEDVTFGDRTNDMSSNKFLNYDNGEIYTEDEDEAKTIDLEKHNLKIIKNGSINIETKQFEETIKELHKKITDNNGFIEQESSENYDGEKTTNLTIRIPNKKFDDFLNTEFKNGSIVNKNISTENIIDDYVDKENRLKSLQTQHERLLAILEKADKVEDMFKIESELASVNTEIETLKGTLNTYDNLVEYSTINIRIKQVENETIVIEDKSFTSRFKKGISETFVDSTEILKDLTISLTELLIYLVVVLLPLGLIGGLIVFIINKFTKGKILKSIKKQFTKPNK